MSSEEIWTALNVIGWRGPEDKKENKNRRRDVREKPRLNCEWQEEPEEIGSWHVGCVKGRFGNAGVTPSATYQRGSQVKRIYDTIKTLVPCQSSLGSTVGHGQGEMRQVLTLASLSCISGDWREQLTTGAICSLHGRILSAGQTCLVLSGIL